MINDAQSLQTYFADLLSTLPDATFMVDPAGRIVLVNALTEQMFGYASDELRGQPIDSLLPDRLRSAHGEHRAHYLSSPRTRPMGVGLTLQGLRKDGTEFPVEISLSPQETDEGLFVIGAIRDISESDERFRTIFDQVAVGIVQTSLEGRILNVNPKFCDLTAYSRDETLLLSAEELIHPADLGASPDALATQVGSMSTDERDVRIFRKDGDLFWAHLTTTLVRGADGTSLHFITVVHDITEQKHAEEGLRESELRFRQVTENIREVFWLTDPSNDEVLYVSPAYEEVWGRSAQDLQAVGGDWVDAIHPEDRQRVMESLQTKQTRGDYDEEFRIVRPDGSTRWIRDRAFPVLDQQGVVVRVTGVAEDITRRKLTTESLHESDRRFSALMHNVELVSVTLDRTGRVTYCNDFFLRLTGWRREEAMGKSWFDVFVPSDLVEELTHVFHELLEDLPSAWHHDNEIQTRSGERRMIRWSNSVLRAPSSEVIGTVSIGEDITEQKLAEAEVVRHVARVEKAMYATIDVIATIGELRDPYTHGHEHRVAELAVAIAGEMGLEVDRIEGLRIAGRLHDVGKIGVPAEILAKPARLTSSEYSLVQEHAQRGYEILRGVDFQWPVAEIAWQHHERVDGTGYPRALMGEQILLEARILAVADTVEAMASHRPYRPGLGIETALAEIEENRGKLYAEEPVDACLRLFREMGYQLPT